MSPQQAQQHHAGSHNDPRCPIASCLPFSPDFISAAHVFVKWFSKQKIVRQFLFPHKNDGFTAPATNQTLVCEMHWHVPLSSRLSFVRQFSSRLSFPRQISKTQPFKIVVAADFCVFRCCRQHARCAEWLAFTRLQVAKIDNGSFPASLKPASFQTHRV